jgi:hypothetical protein
MTNLIVPWSSHQQMIVTDPGPWILKETIAGVITYCPDCRGLPATEVRPLHTGRCQLPLSYDEGRTDRA